MSTEVVKVEPKVQTLQKLLDRAKPAITAALPKTLTTEKFMRVVLTSMRLNPKLADTTPASFISCILQAAQLGLVPDGILGHAYLVPFHDNKKDLDICTLIPGYKGLVELALRSNMVSTIEAAVVYTKDQWTYERGLAPKLVHVPVEVEEPGEMRLAYAIATMKDGTKRAEVLFRRDVLRIKNFSQTGRKNYGPWKDWEEEMWKKTAIRRLCKLLPLSPEDRRVIDMDEAHDAGQPIDMSEVVEIPYDLTPAIDEASGEKPKSRLDAAAGKLAVQGREALARTFVEGVTSATALADAALPAASQEDVEILPPSDIDTKIGALILRVGEDRIREWLYTGYAITKIEEVHKLSVKSKVELLRQLEAGEVEIETEKRTKTTKGPKMSPRPALFDAEPPTPGTE